MPKTLEPPPSFSEHPVRLWGLPMQNASSDGAILDAILSAAVDAIVVADANGTILRANASAEAMFGFKSGELTKRNVRILMPEPMASQHDSYMRHHIETGENRIIGIGRDVEGIRKDGQVFPLHLSVGEALIGEERIFVAVLHDLTSRRAAEAALARSQRLDAIGQMTGGISHDFNNLLTVIIGNLELAEMAEPGERIAPLIADALDAAEMGASLTSRLLLFARKGDLKPTDVDLREICRSTVDMLRRTLGETYRIVTEYPPTLPLVRVDPIQLQSALVNLALNARDAMPGKGNLRLEISEIEIDDQYMAQETDVVPGRYIRILVSDDGSGMTPEAQKRAFEPFFTTKSDQNGTGLGLSMVYGFIRQSGGHITVYSEPGYGTSFGLYFPISEADRTAITVEDQRAMAVKIPEGAGQTVLVVEDNPSVRKISIERLHDLNYRTVEAKSGDEAYALLKSGAKIDVVFTDVVMPGGLNGFTLAAKITSEFPEVKVLLTSGYASDVVAGNGSLSTTEHILHKPYHQRELARRLHFLLTGDPS